jgi:hypothetical protein
MPCNFVTCYDSPGLARHPQLRKEKPVNVGRLFNALVQCRAAAVARTGTRSQKNRILGSIRSNQARRHLARMIGRDSSVVCAGHH